MKKLELFSKQWDVLFSKKRYVVAIAGRQSGKTTLGCVWVHKKISDNPLSTGLIASPSYKILNQSTLDKFFSLLPEYRSFYKEQKGEIVLPIGSKIYIRSTDEPLGLEGMTLDWAWLDEAGMMSPLVWKIIRARTSIKKGQVLITTSPYFMNWLYQEVYVPFVKMTDKDIEVFQWTSLDNPYFDREFYEKEKSRLSETDFARMYEGVFTKMSGLVYSDFSNKNIIEPKEMNYVEATIAGVDFGFNNPSAIIVIKVKDNSFYLVDEFYEKGKTNGEIIDACLSLQKKHGINYFYPDPAEPDRIEEMRRAGLYVKETNKDIKYGISVIQQLIKENRFFVFNTLSNFLEEINFYHFDENKLNDLPIKEKDHLLDATRYAIVGFLSRQSVILENNNKISTLIFERKINPVQFE